MVSELAPEIYATMRKQEL